MGIVPGWKDVFIVLQVISALGTAMYAEAYICIVGREKDETKASRWVLQQDKPCGCHKMAMGGVNTRTPITSYKPKYVNDPVLSSKLDEIREHYKLDCKANCREISDEIRGNGSNLHMIDPDGIGGLEPFIVTCNEDGNTIVTHNLEANHLVSGYEEPGSYIKKVTYSASLEQIAALIDTSSTCRQYIRLRCFGSTFSDYGNRHQWWQNRHDDRMFNWGSPKGTIGCDCGVKGDCATSTDICNCNENDGVWREDYGYLRDKEDLPVTAISISDTGSANEEAKVTLGSLICNSN